MGFDCITYKLIFYIVIPVVEVSVHYIGEITAILSCTVVRGNPSDYNYKWIFNSEENVISGNLQLIVTNFSVEKSGTYFCHVNNQVGTGIGRAVVTAVGKLL